MKRIIVDNRDGTVTILTPMNEHIQQLLQSSGEDGELIYSDLDECITAIAEKDCGGNPYEIVATEMVPTERTFRNAWKQGGSGVDVDMPRARVIQMDRIRGKRDKKWGDLDQAYMLCDEQADAPGKSAIAAQKQVLRDIPTTFDLESITDPDVLKDTWPPEVL